MKELRSTLLAEGTNDEALTYHLTWLLTRNFDQKINFMDIEIQKTAFVAPQELEGIPRRDLVQRMQTAIENHPCHILFVHRDADTTDAEPRHQEIETAAKKIRLGYPFVIAVVPIQAVEAWLLFNDEAIFQAVGKTPQPHFSLPPLRNIEQHHDPKALFHQTLRAAFGGAGRRSAAFRPYQSRYYTAIASAIAGSKAAFEPLLDPRNNVSAFQKLNHMIEELVGTYPLWYSDL